MKKSIALPIFLILISIFFTNCKNEFETCTISGKIVGRSSDTLILMNGLDDPRFAKIRIPIIDSTFTYDIQAKPIQAHWLVFQDEFETAGFRPIVFFPDNQNVNFTLHSMEKFENNIIEGGKLNSQFKEFNDLNRSTFMSRYEPINDSISILYEKDLYQSDSMKVLYDRLRNSTSQDTNIVIYRKMAEIRKRGNDLTEAGRRLNNKNKEISKEQFHWMLDYFENNPSICSYYYFISRYLMYPSENSDITRFMKIQEMYSDIFKDHPYVAIANDLIGSYNNIKVGGKYIDFTVPDLDGNEHTLSELIDGKIALIDLWATWCGPCIATARTMVSVYEDYKDKGFTVVGVAAEIDNIERLIARLEKEKFPWMNLVELNHQNNIWHKYGISNSGGKTFLVDKNGEIIAIGPSADEVRKILEEKL